MQTALKKRVITNPPIAHDMRWRGGKEILVQGSKINIYIPKIGPEVHQALPHDTSLFYFF